MAEVQGQPVRLENPGLPPRPVAEHEMHDADVVVRPDQLRDVLDPLRDGNALLEVANATQISEVDARRPMLLSAFARRRSRPSSSAIVNASRPTSIALSLRSASIS